jgi:hypothetical protein
MGFKSIFALEIGAQRRKFISLASWHMDANFAKHAYYVSSNLIRNTERKSTHRGGRAGSKFLRKSKLRRVKYFKLFPHPLLGLGSAATDLNTIFTACHNQVKTIFAHHVVWI